MHLACCIGSLESWPLDHQGSAPLTFFRIICASGFMWDSGIDRRHFESPSSGMCSKCPLEGLVTSGGQRAWAPLQWSRVTTYRLLDLSPYSFCICSVLQFSRSVMSNSATPWTAAHQASLSITNSWSLPKLMSIESVMPSNHLIPCHPLFLQPSIFPSIRVFSNESALRNRWPKYWSFSFNISPSSEHPGLICFRMD